MPAIETTRESFKLHVSGPAGCPAGAKQTSVHISKDIQGTEAIFKMQAAAPV